MLSGDDNENSQKQSVDLVSKITTLHMQHTFFVHFFAVVLHDYNEKLPETSWLHVLYAPVHFFCGCRWFSPWWPLASPFSHHCYKIFMFFFQRNWSPLFFISRSSSFSVIHVNVDIKIKWEERIGFAVVVFISKRLGSYAIKRQNARVLEMQNFIPGYMKGRTYGRTYSVRTTFSEPKFLGCIDYQIFLSMLLRALESSAIKKRQTFRRGFRLPIFGFS